MKHFYDDLSIYLSLFTFITVLLSVQHLFASMKAKCSGCFLLFQNLINLSPNQRKDIIQATMKETGTVGRMAPYSLKDFSVEYFRYL